MVAFYRAATEVLKPIRNREIDYDKNKPSKLHEGQRRTWCRRTWHRDASVDQLGLRTGLGRAVTALDRPVDHCAGPDFGDVPSTKRRRLGIGYAGDFSGFSNKNPVGVV